MAETLADKRFHKAYAEHHEKYLGEHKARKDAVKAYHEGKTSDAYTLLRNKNAQKEHERKHWEES